MLISSSTISENIIHVWKPLADQMSRKVLQDLGLLHYMKNHIYINSSYTGPSKSWRDIQTRHAILNEPGMTVNIKFNSNPIGLKYTSASPGQHMDPAIHRRDALIAHPLLYDPATRIHVIEREQPCMLEMECALTFTDRVVAFDAVTNMMSTYVRGELLTVTNFSYDYKFPVPLLNELYVLARLSGVEKGKVMDWITKYSHGKMKLITNEYAPGKHHEMVVHREPYEILATIDYNPDEPTVEGVGTSADTVTLSFNVTMQFGRVNMLYLKYPIVINNELVPQQLVHVERSDAYGRLIRYLKHPYLSMDGIYQGAKFLYRMPTRQPWYDNWLIPDYTRHKFEKAEPFFIGVFTLDNTACTSCQDKCKCDCCPCRFTTIDLWEDIEPYRLRDHVKKFFQEHPKECLLPDAHFNLSVFADDVQVDPKHLVFDGRYLKFPNTMGANRIYRLVLCRTPLIKEGKNPWYFVFDCIIVVQRENFKDKKEKRHRGTRQSQRHSTPPQEPAR